MKQWIIRKLISIMGSVYVLLDRRLTHPKGPILGLEIDDDFEAMSRYELCCHIEDKFGLKRDSFWELESTQKIRYCSQTARNILSKK
ncbi:MAG: hypothetical protein GOVbin1753_24 [Prokaryotic dsDNA virus sp.]|nr:MAG: hypothetical protein GOVbin1753_24 [Prokaryotic dsDNA virus sp.]|tara:strand:+ start:122 stop:382 length:261 start_codon:yes stop_codon:yes gene_type:complete